MAALAEPPDPGTEQPQAGSVIAALGSTMAPLRYRFLGRAQSGSGGYGRFSFLPLGVTSSELWIPKNLFAAAAKSGIRVPNFARGLFVENAVAGKVLQSGIRAAEILECGSRRISSDLVGVKGHAGAIVEGILVGRNPGNMPIHWVGGPFRFPRSARIFFFPPGLVGNDGKGRRCGVALGVTGAAPATTPLRET
jgi:hypothetical protein